MTIGIFDSGIGGLGIFQEIRKLMPNEQILYLADTKNCPFGDKTEQQLKQICLDNSRFLIEKGADIIVVACNTGSTIALKYVRNKLNLNQPTRLSKVEGARANTNICCDQRDYQCRSASIPVVGVVPVVKTCSEVSKNKKIGILATKRTVESRYLRDLVEKFCPEKDGYRVYYQAANSLVQLIENGKWKMDNKKK